MKTTLSFLFLMLCLHSGFAQAPVISGDTMLCPWTDGTASIEGTQVYDSYTWYYKYWFLPDEYVAIPGANGPSFTYDWYTYDQSLFKVVVTLGGNTYESNTIQIDSYAWVGMVVSNETGDNITFDPETESFALCDGTTMAVEIFNPYSANIQWFKNDDPIPGANSMVYQISGPGTYTVTAAPPFCPNSTSTSLPITVTMNPNCNLNVGNPDALAGLTLYPNPAKDNVTLNLPNKAIESVTVYNMAGQLVYSEKANIQTVTVPLNGFASGVYVIDVQADGSAKKLKFIKE